MASDTMIAETGIIAISYESLNHIYYKILELKETLEIVQFWKKLEAKGLTVYQNYTGISQ